MRVTADKEGNGSHAPVETLTAGTAEERNRAMKKDNVSPGPPPNRPEEEEPETSDVAGFFTWANLEGSKYRDYSASREKVRADARERNEVERSKDETAEITLPSTVETGNPVQPNRPPSSAVQRKLATMPAVRRAPAQRTQRPPIQHHSSRWVVSKGAFQPEESDYREDAPDLGLPALAFFSLAGGTGKTSLAASMGCLLAADGSSSLLVDTHVYGLLPLFFGARELSPGTSRTFASSDSAPLRVMTLDHSLAATDHPPVEQIMQHADGMDRILIDLSTGSVSLLRNILSLSPTVLVVLAPNMASVVSLQTVQATIDQMEEETGVQIRIFFVLNQFDVSLRMHRDVRERLTRQLGKRFLPFAVRRTHAVSEALSTGMTIVDYAPDSQTVEDLRDVTQWIRELDGPVVAEMQDVRWRQR